MCFAARELDSDGPGGDKQRQAGESANAAAVRTWKKGEGAKKDDRGSGGKTEGVVTAACTLGLSM